MRKKKRKKERKKERKDNKKKKLQMEMRGIEPRASRMQSERSTI
jgi:hypothetical protein